MVATLAYLAIQILQNTHAMDEGKRLALALVQASESEHIGPIITQLTLVDYPEDLVSLDVRAPEERGRLRQWQIAQQTGEEDVGDGSKPTASSAR